MARITIEDCLEKISCPFTLVEVAAARARKLHNDKMEQGMYLTAPSVETPAAPGVVTATEEEDQPTVQALRDVADGKVGEAVLYHHDLEDRMQVFRSRMHAHSMPEDAPRPEDF